MFRLTDGGARILPQFLSFYLPHDNVTIIHAGARDNRHCERENACGGVPKRKGALKVFGRIKVQTLAVCVAGECFTHCAMPLGHVYLG